MAQPTTTKRAVPDLAPASSAVFAGPVAGIAGGLVMAGYLVIAAVALGMEPLTALAPMGATLRSPDTIGGGAGWVLFGLSLHLAVSAVVGLIFAVIVPRDHTPAVAAFLCVGLTFAVMAFMTSVVVPAVNPVLQASFHGLGGSWVIAHVLFGATAGYTGQRLRRGRGPRGSAQ